MYNAIICRYHEIAIKGNNRNMFETRMIENIYHLLRPVENIRVSKVRGRIWVEHKDKTPFTEKELDLINTQMPKAFGLESFSPVIMTEPSLEAMQKAVDNSCRQYFDKAFENQKVVSFRIRGKRSDKKFPLDSKQIEIELARIVGKHYDYDSLNIDLENADVTVWCELRAEFAFVYYETIRGPGGLPVGSNSPVLALLSGGIDSPVACYEIMKRGCRCDFITFHSSPYTPQDTVDKVKTIAKYLNRFQLPRRLFICNLAPMQKLIRDNCTPRFRTVLYRRMMFRIAERVAIRHKRFALLTGESVGQVASQTIVNMATIDNATNMLVLRPLVGADKNDVVNHARRIGTYNLSKQQVPDSCTVFAPPSPATSAPVPRIEEEEAKLPEWEKVMEEIIDSIEICDSEPDLQL
ncbi:MAG: tRNA 4-thiouridine(8) synthase ThiI [Lentisphaerae bacterium]|nr:tRNA 4-thiouridine(8) synthase ThiI [Lentisphaerota bacterium]MCP4101469.1 tRNA 4-thiouridine(8) synthase ThiI [Lentisphaerota bacterium]